MTSILDLFEEHDQAFVLKESEVYKLHVIKESVRNFFLVDKIFYGLLLMQEEGMGPLIIMRDQCLSNISTFWLERK